MALYSRLGREPVGMGEGISQSPETCPQTPYNSVIESTAWRPKDPKFPDLATWDLHAYPKQHQLASKTPKSLVSALLRSSGPHTTL